MKKVVMALVGVLAIIGVCSAGQRPELKDEDDRISYSVGYQMGGDFKDQELDIRPDAFLQGIQDALAGAEPRLSQDEMRQILVDLKKRVVAVQQEKRQAEAEKNMAAGKAFLEANGRKEGVKTLPSGLQYKVIRKGTGKTPKADDIVTVNYRGTLVDGTEFDSSYRRKKPATFRVDRIIPGWTEALQLMKEGAKWQVYIPPDLAYGERGAGARIPPNSTLIFEIELISVDKRSRE